MLAPILQNLNPRICILNDAFDKLRFVPKSPILEG